MWLLMKCRPLYLLYYNPKWFIVSTEHVYITREHRGISDPLLHRAMHNDILQWFKRLTNAIGFPYWSQVNYVITHVCACVVMLDPFNIAHINLCRESFSKIT